MQTFLPYADFAGSARCLDSKRLGKQIIECRQIGKAITQPDYGWQNHPAVNMWRGYETALLAYARACNEEWHKRKSRDHGAYINMIREDGYTWEQRHAARYGFRRPPWLGSEAFHASHRSNLLRKDEEWYGQFEWVESSDLEYVWPSKA